MLTEVVKDLFEVDESYHLAHCISADLKMGAGIAVPFQAKYHIREAIQARQLNLVIPTVVMTGRVFNLVTKVNYYGKPTYDNVFLALDKMKTVMDYFNVKKVAMPRIGCGIDGLHWEYFKRHLRDNFDGYDILVCRLEK